MNRFYIKGPPKKVRGPTQKNELWNMQNNKIVVKFNKYGQPVGVEGNELTQFLGSVVRIAANVGLDCQDWRKVDKEKKEDMYSIVKVFVLQSKYECFVNIVRFCIFDNYYNFHCRKNLFSVRLKQVLSRNGFFLAWGKS